jgi:transcriptional regulator with XRE-family HTH domain/quercetin dioxygenase-like cupin family protein
MSGHALGERLRSARMAKGYTLRELARQIGVSASLLSQVENGKSQASVTNLHALVTALDISLDELFTSTEAPEPPPSAAPSVVGMPQESAYAALEPVHRSGTRPILKMAGGVTWERLSSLLSHLVDAQLVTYEPGSSSSVDGTLSRHNGTEFAYLIEGELLLRLGYEEYHLKAGDSLSFDSTTPHLYQNLGETPARGVWFELGRRVAVGLSSAEPLRSPHNGAVGPPPHLH